MAAITICSDFGCDDLEGWDGGGVQGRLKREGIHVYIWLIHFIVQQKLAQHCKAIILPKKVNKYIIKSAS